MADLDADGKLLRDAMKALAKEASNDFKTASPAYEKAAREMQEALARDGDSAEIDFYRDQLEKAIDLVDDNVSATQGVMNYVEEIRNKGYSDALAAEVGTTLKEIGPMRAKLLGFVSEGRELGKKALKARDAAGTSAGELDAGLASAKDRVKDVLGKIGDLAGATKPIIAAARKAYADGKQQGFFAEREKLHPIAQRRKMLDSARTEVDALMKKLPKDDRDRRSEAQHLLDDLKSRELDFDALDAEIKKLMAMPLIKAAAPPPRPKLDAGQVKKIAVILGCDAKQVDKVVNNNPHDKWPAAIAKACGLKEADVKAKMPQVNRLDFVKSLHLIDI